MRLRRDCKPYRGGSYLRYKIWVQDWGFLGSCPKIWVVWLEQHRAHGRYIFHEQSCWTVGTKRSSCRAVRSRAQAPSPSPPPLQDCRNAAHLGKGTRSQLWKDNTSWTNIQSRCAFLISLQMESVRVWFRAVVVLWMSFFGTGTRALFRCEKFWVYGIVALSFVFGNYCPAMS